jgi:hypothetical protein
MGEEKKSEDAATPPPPAPTPAPAPSADVHVPATQSQKAAALAVAKTLMVSPTSESLRRELDRMNRRQLLDEREDLGRWPRPELEHEVLRLRVLLNHATTAAERQNHFLRDVMSHVSSGKDSDALAINTTVEDADGRTIEQKDVGSTPMSVVLANAGRRALGGGLLGSAAMIIQVVTLMPMRTTMNYQYAHGKGTLDAARFLYKEAGMSRFYRGIGPALFQGPLSRFGDTAANTGMLTLLNANESTRDLPVVAKTAAASSAAALWRINLMPIDMLKTTLQTQGQGLVFIRKKIAMGGVGVLWHGAGAAAAASFAGHLPWFTTYNVLQERIPQAETFALKLARNAAIGFTASVVSDTCS